VPTPHQPGSIITGEITSPALAGNLLGDPDTRNYMVYLPPSYYSSDKRYPVVYFLHGNTEDETTHATPFGVALDEMIANGDAPEMIVVFPNTKTAFIGLGLYDSPTTGDYPTYLSHDLVNHIDANFRTIPHRDSRGIASCGDGTTNVLNLAFTHPDIFSVPVAMTGIYIYENHKLLWESSPEAFKGVPTDSAEIEAEMVKDPWAYWPVLFLMNLAAGAAPNPDNPPFYLDMPLAMVDGQAQIVPEVAAKINAMDPAHFLQAYLDQPLKFRGMLIYQKTRNSEMPVESARAFDELLTQAGVEHEYIEASGGDVAPWHCDNELAIQFMAEHLSLEMVE
jgi:S-formylglutathione hydrolase FrmB